MNTSANIVISTQSLTKTFRGVTALESLNLTVHKNSIFGFLGPNGAGNAGHAGPAAADDHADRSDGDLDRDLRRRRAVAF